jgi:mannose/cellobiose epimerase-like protein (N-acyl-D-glucosamine 2-epimerase family)
MKPSLPDFRSPDVLREHVLHTMSFYDGRCVDPSGGFYHFFKDDGTVYDATTRHLVSSARFVVTHAMALRHFAGHARTAAWRDAAAHGLAFLRDAHRNPATGGYAWLLRWDHGKKEILDPTNHCYGLAFVLLAHAQALLGGMDGARAGLEETFELMEHRFWESAHSLYADEAGPAWEHAPYRGQNVNMHACEALLAAHEATADPLYLQRAALIADAVTHRLAAQTSGLVWEHYHVDWTPDWEYHRGNVSDQFRPWGFQPGHLAEWAKLLITLERALPESAEGGPRVHKARELFAAAVERAWDRQHGGLYYGFAPDHSICDNHKYFWVQAEAIAAAAVLGERTAEGHYWDWYDRLWAYCWEHFIDHQHGAWYRILSANNHKLSDEKSPAGKVDYHTMGACYEAIAALTRNP